MTKTSIGADEPGGSDEQPAAVRTESFEFAGPAELDLEIGSGRIEIDLVDEPGVRVEVTHESSAGAEWMQGLSGLLNWVSDQFGAQSGGVGQPGAPFDPAGEAVRQTRIDRTGQRVVLKAPKSKPLKLVPVRVRVSAPNGSQVTARSGAGDVIVTGTANRLNVNTGTGQISVDRADGVATVVSGSGPVRLGPMLGGVRARTGSGDLEVSSIGAASTLGTGSGDVWLGAVQADVQVRTGTGDLTVADAAVGDIKLNTGSGELRIAIRPGVVAELDLEASSGHARSELEVSQERPADRPAVRVTGRTGSGNVVVTSSLS